VLFWVYRVSRLDERAAGAIVVLGAAVQRAVPVLQARLDHALALYRRTARWWWSPGIGTGDRMGRRRQAQVPARPGVPFGDHRRPDGRPRRIVRSVGEWCTSRSSPVLW
jgi:hypothetical protein